MKKTILLITCWLFSMIGQSEAAYLPPTPFHQAGAVSAQYLATQAGIDILKAGGNAVDAAVAVGYALAVVHPCCGNIGGGGFMLIHLNSGKNLVIDFRETAPAAIKPQLFLDAQGHVQKQLAENSYLSVGVPGTVMGLNTALQKYGSMPLAKVMAPAIRLAQEGFVLNNDDIHILGKVRSAKTQPNVANIFLKNAQPLQVGDRLVQPELAKSLLEISQQGSKAFYQGSIAEKIVAASQANHGALAMRDFTGYSVKERNVITCQYHGYEIVTDPPPSSGITICEILNIVNRYPLKELGFHSAANVHYNVEAMRYAFADRNQDLGDPDFVSNPTAKLNSQAYAQQIAEKIQADRAGNSKQLELNPDKKSTEGAHTTHYAVVDRWGNAVGVTYTINDYFGSGLIAKDTGFFLNDSMDDFTISVTEKNMFQLQQGKTNLIAPKKRPLSSMSPTMVFKNHQLYMIIGAAGGPTIITTIVEGLENAIDFGMDINAAINQPRYHFQWIPDTIYLEPYTLSADTLLILQKMGYQVHWGSVFNTDYWGQALVIMRDPQTGTLYGATDNRHAGGMSLGY